MKTIALIIAMAACGTSDDSMNCTDLGNAVAAGPVSECTIPTAGLAVAPAGDGTGGCAFVEGGGSCISWTTTTATYDFSQSYREKVGLVAGAASGGCVFVECQ